jgi:hypothetical protein
VRHGGARLQDPRPAPRWRQRPALVKGRGPAEPALREGTGTQP